MCGYLKQYAMAAWNDLRFRYYRTADGNNADTHNSKPWGSDGYPDNKAKIHIHVGRLAGTDAQLAETIVHEAYHGYYNSADDNAARNAGIMCVPSGYP